MPTGKLFMMASCLTVLGLVVASCAPSATSTPTPKPAAAAPTKAPGAAPTEPKPAAPSPTPKPAAEQPKYGGVVVLRTRESPTTFDPHRASLLIDIETNSKYYSLLFYNREGSIIEPDLVKSFEYADGGATFILHLREGVRFWDGRPLTSEDVKYSLNKIMGKVDRVVQARVGAIKEYIKEIDTPDAHTVVLRLQQPAPILLQYLAAGNSGIIKTGTTAADLTKAPMGTGPYLLDRWVPGSHMLLKRNPDYFKPGLPYVAGLRLVQVTDENAGLAAFLVGRLDWFSTDSSLPPDRLNSLREMEKKGQVVLHQQFAWSTVQGALFNTTRPPFDDVRVRRAVHLAYDRQAFASACFDGQAIEQLFFPPGMPFARSREEVLALPGYRQPKDADVKQAKELLAEAGYADGLKVEVLTRDMKWITRTGEFLAGQLAKIGIQSEIKILAGPALFSTMGELKYQVAGYLMSMSTGDPDEVFGSLFVTGGARNWWGYSNPELDKLFLQQSAEMDYEKRKATIRKMEDILLQDLPALPNIDRVLYSMNWSYVHWKAGKTRYAQGHMQEVWTEKRD